MIPQHRHPVAPSVLLGAKAGRSVAPAEALAVDRDAFHQRVDLQARLQLQGGAGAGGDAGPARRAGGVELDVELGPLFLPSFLNNPRNEIDNTYISLRRSEEHMSELQYLMRTSDP